MALKVQCFDNVKEIQADTIRKVCVPEMFGEVAEVLGSLYCFPRRVLPGRQLQLDDLVFFFFLAVQELFDNTLYIH